MGRRKKVDKQSVIAKEVNTSNPSTVTTSKDKLHCHNDLPNASNKEGNRSLNGSPSADINFKVLYEAEQRKVEELEKHEFELNKQLHLAYGKIEVYENLLNQQHATEPTEAMRLSPRTAQRCIPLANTAPDHHHNILSSPKGKKNNQKATPDATDIHKASPPKKKRKYRKKNVEA